MNYIRNPQKLNVYTEGRKRRTFVGVLSFNRENKKYIFEYDHKYLRSKSAIQLGPDLSLAKQIHTSKSKEVFASFADRIPLKSNPAYEEYCHSQGISPSEDNPIILLGSIGKRGPSTFVFESDWILEDDVLEKFDKLRDEVDLSMDDAAKTFGLSLATLKKLSIHRKPDHNLEKLLSIYLSFPEVTLWQLQQSAGQLHQDTSSRLFKYFQAALTK